MGLDGDLMRLDQLDRLELIDRGSHRVRPTEIIDQSIDGDPLGLDRLESAGQWGLLLLLLLFLLLLPLLLLVAAAAAGEGAVLPLPHYRTPRGITATALPR